MKQNSEDKEFYGVDCAGKNFKKMSLGAGSRIFLIILIIWHWCPLTALGQQLYPFFEETFLASNYLPESVTKFVTSENSGKVIEDRGAARLTIREALYYSLQGNHDVQISSYGPQQAREDLLYAESVYDSSLFLSGSHDRTLDTESNINDPTVEDDTNVQIGVKKLLPTGGTLSLFWETQRFDKTHGPFEFKERYTSVPTIELKQPLLQNIGAKAEKAAIKIQNNNVTISEADFQRTVHDIVSQVSHTYWRLYMHSKIAEINQDTLDMAGEVHRREVVRLADGIAKPLDVARARSAAEARRTEILRSKERVQQVTEQLKFLLNWSEFTLDSRDRIIPVESPRTEAVHVILEQAIKKGLENRPEIQKARKHLDIASVRKKLSRHQRLPKLDAVMNYGVNGYGGQFSDAMDTIDIDDRNTWTLGLTFEMPIGNRSANATYRKQRLYYEQASLAVQRAENQVKLDVKQAIWAMEFARQEITSTLLEKTEAENVVAGEFERFELGQMTNEELLRAQDFLANARRNYIQAVVKYNIALADLDRAQSILPYGLEIETREEKKNFVVSMNGNHFEW